MQLDPFSIKKIAVLGSGVMGAQIAAHFANAGIPALLFDLASNEKDKNAFVKKALHSLTTLQPSPLAEPNRISLITPANYEDNLPLIADCDLVIEAISERFEWKQELYQKIQPFLKHEAALVTNTSGLSITELSKSLSEEHQSRFCGVHFFNPPRYMPLIEITPHAHTDSVFLENLETFLVNRLGKNIIYAKDTPNFVANRVGVFSLLSSIVLADQYNLPPDVVDLLTGPIIRRSKSATFRTIDIIGLDTFKSVVETMDKGLNDDPWHRYFHLPEWFKQLISKGALGQKTKAGIYKKNKEIEVIDTKEGQYRPQIIKISKEMDAILKIESPLERFQKLRKSQLPEAQFLWACYRELFQYCAYHLEAIAHSARDIDLAFRFGFGWEEGPFELWQSIGFETVTKWLQEEIDQKRALTAALLPKWVFEIAKQGVYETNTAFSPAENSYVTRSQLPIYKRQIFKERVLLETEEEGRTIFETEAVRLWTLDEAIAILSFKTKGNTINLGVLEGIQESILRTEKEFKALILWQRDSKDFSFGANLKEILDMLNHNNLNGIKSELREFQKTALALRFANIPTIAATRGKILGGGTEFMMHCTRAVCALESYPGLVETGVGLIPAGGGCKEMALRASLAMEGMDPFEKLMGFFNESAKATVAKSALDAKRLGYLRESDICIMNPNEVLYYAIQEALTLAQRFEPAFKQPIVVAGKDAAATLKAGLINLLEGQFITEHDYEIAQKLATVMCGGELYAGTKVEESWILELEREVFMELIQTPKTKARIEYTLTQGKPLRN